MGMPRFVITNNFMLFCNAKTSRKPYLYSRFRSQYPTKILELGHDRNSWSAHLHYDPNVKCPVGSPGRGKLSV